MASKLRQSGLSILGDVPWGMHLCIFFETKQDLLDTLLPYFHAGLQDNEFVFWAVGGPLTVEEAHAAMARGIPDYQQHLSRGQVEIVAGSEWYLGRDLKKLTDGWREKINIALAKGFAGVRVSGNAFWLETEYRDDFLAYEQELDESLAGDPILALCSYPLFGSRAADILDVARAHQITAARRNGRWEFIQTAGAPSSHSLTLREIEILTWVARGKSALEAAKTLGISKRTVDAHVHSAMEKLGASNRTEVVALAVRRNIVALDPAGRPARRRESKTRNGAPRT
jgi:DNA-binding CsgD family transcriptional regulator